MMKLILAVFLVIFCNGENDDHAFEPTKCEICAIVANEWSTVAEKKVIRSDSEFADASDDFCKSFNQFKVHKEKTGVERFSRKPSKTIESLKEMRAKGVKVEIGMPYEMWDEPSTEITVLRQGCEQIMEDYEDDIEEWFKNKGDAEDLKKTLCIKKVLKNHDASCLRVRKNEL